MILVLINSYLCSPLNFLIILKSNYLSTELYALKKSMNITFSFLFLFVTYSSTLSLIPEYLVFLQNLTMQNKPINPFFKRLYKRVFNHLNYMWHHHNRLHVSYLPDLKSFFVKRDYSHLEYISHLFNFSMLYNSY